MAGVLVLVAAAALGIDYGWQPVAGGGIEYIIQIEPEVFETLRAGQDVFSDLPPAMQGVRSYRITVGNERLPHQGEPPPPPVAESQDEADDQAWLPPDFDRTNIPLPGPVFDQVLPDVGGLAGHGPEFGPAAAEPDPFDPDANSRPLVKPAGGRSRSPDSDSPDSGSPGDDRGPPPTAIDRKTSEPGASDVAKAERHANKARIESDPSQDAAEPPSPSDRSPCTTAPDQAASQKPWWPLSLTLLGLFASVGGNAYLLLVVAGLRRRYRLLLRKALATPGGADARQASGADAVFGEPQWEQLPPDAEVE